MSINTAQDIHSTSLLPMHMPTSTVIAQPRRMAQDAASAQIMQIIGIGPEKLSPEHFFGMQVTSARAHQTQICRAKKSKASGDADASSSAWGAAPEGDADVVSSSAPAPARKARKPKQEKEPGVEASEPEVKPKRTRKPKAAPQQQPEAGPEVAQPSAAAEEPQYAAAEVLPQSPEHAEAGPGPSGTGVPDEEWTDSATSVLSESLKRRGRPRVMDEHGAPASPLDDLEDESSLEPESIVSPEVVEALKEIEPPEWYVKLRDEELPTNWAEAAYGEAKLSQRYWEARRKESKDIEEAAWMSHHHQNRYAANRYLTVRRVARIMAEVENHDYMRENKAPHHIPSWARAEVIFQEEFDEFNEFTKESMEKLGRVRLQQEEEEEARELHDQLDMLSPVSSRSSSSDRTKMDQSSTEDRLMKDYLDNILPGATLSSMSESFADDIFAADADPEDDDAIGVSEEVAVEAPAEVDS